ncbi:MAG: hypothetical protein EG825_05830 [Rhodocyclaceae bacterium]|nr:hypothetical protein [Rhodocyclaceae bacterium]
MAKPTITKLPSALDEVPLEDPYKELRKAIIGLAYGEGNKGRRWKKEMVRAMLGPIAAARSNGETFEDIAALMTERGYPITSSTLRNYYFALKADSELKVLVREQAEILAECRRRLVNETTRERVRIEAVKELAARRKQFRLSEKVASQPGTGPNVDAPQNEVAVERKLSQRQHVNATSGTVGKTRRQGLTPPAPVTNTPIAADGNTQPQKPAPMAALDAQNNAITSGRAPSITLLEKLAKDISDKVPITMDVELRDGVHAYYTDGRPLDVAISIRQTRLLRSSGRLIAQVDENRTSKDFVPFPKRL